jgi:RIO kinase 1
VQLEEAEPFVERELIRDVLHPLNGGKEAVVYLCSAGRLLHERTGEAFAVLKVFRPRAERNFKDRSLYRAGRVVTDSRAARAVRTRTAFGRNVEEGLWLENEFDSLETLFAVGCDVPEPLDRAGAAILMRFIGDERGPAPQLRHVRLERIEAEEALTRILANVELALRHNVVHADLSPFNILWWEGRPVIIDLPQAIDPRTNPNAEALLARDVTNVCRFFASRGVDRDSDAVVRDLWVRFLFAEL